MRLRLKSNRHRLESEVLGAGRSAFARLEALKALERPRVLQKTLPDVQGGHHELNIGELGTRIDVTRGFEVIRKVLVRGLHYFEKEKLWNLLEGEVWQEL